MTLTPCVKSLSRRIGTKTENKDGVGYDGSNCQDPYSQRIIGEKEWVSAFLEGENARKSLLWQLYILRERICVSARLAGRKSGNETRSDGDCRQTS